MSIPADDGKASAVLIAGPTASGKSALALDIAERSGGVIVNADSMQVYDALRILTARPNAADTARIEHRLYGHVPAADSYSVGRWSREVAALLGDPALKGRPVVFAGGTGLYFKALLGGLSAMPPIPDAARDLWRTRLAEEGPHALHAALMVRDPETAAALKPGDSQRIVRALQVFEATGQSIRTFRETAGRPLIDLQTARRIVLHTDRAALRKRIRTRFERMMEQGAVQEVQALLAQKLSPDLPAMKAIGVREIAAFLDGNLSADEAIERAAIATGQYAKRQTTWFRNQFGTEWQTIVP